jgi:hypothetical protein
MKILIPFVRLAFIFVFVLWFNITCKKSTQVHPEEQSAGNVLPGITIPEAVGYNLHITGPDRDLNRIYESGIKVVRKDLFWNSVERSIGIFTFNDYDNLVAGLEKRGILTLFILCYRNPLYPNPESTEEGREAYARFAAKAVEHFKGRDVIWELWNEPNVKHFWEGPADHNSDEFADQYVSLVKKTVPEMRKADSTCYILGGAVSCLWVNSFRWLDRCFKQGLLGTGINALSVHPYGFARPELCIDEGYGHLRNMLNQYGASNTFPVLNTEVGYNADEAYLGPEHLRLEHQAWHFVRQYLVDLMCGIRMTIWYNWNDDHGFRLVNDDMSALPVYTACQTMIELLSGYHFVEKIETGSDLDYVLAFENEQAHRKLVCWTTPQNRDDTPEKARSHAVHISIDSNYSSVNLYDLNGSVNSSTINDGKITLILSGSPQYVDIND